MTSALAAVDLGASSGRVMLGRVTILPVELTGFYGTPGLAAGLP